MTTDLAGCRGRALPAVRRVDPFRGRRRPGDVARISIPSRCTARAAGEGYMLCDDCGMLAELPADLTIN